MTRLTRTATGTAVRPYHTSLGPFSSARSPQPSLALAKAFLLISLAFLTLGFFCVQPVRAQSSYPSGGSGGGYPSGSGGSGYPDSSGWVAKAGDPVVTGTVSSTFTDAQGNPFYHVSYTATDNTDQVSGTAKANIALYDEWEDKRNATPATTPCAKRTYWASDGAIVGVSNTTSMLRNIGSQQRRTKKRWLPGSRSPTRLSYCSKSTAYGCPIKERKLSGIVSFFPSCPLMSS